MIEHTDKAHRLRFVTCKADRQAIALRHGGDGTREAGPSEVTDWALSLIDNQLDEIVSQLYDARKP